MLNLFTLIMYPLGFLFFGLFLLIFTYFYLFLLIFMWVYFYCILQGTFISALQFQPYYSKNTVPL